MFLLFLYNLPKPFIVALLGIANPPPTTICAKYVRIRRATWTTLPSKVTFVFSLQSQNTVHNRWVFV